MSQQQQSKILQAFLAEQLQSLDLVMDQDSFRFIESQLSLAEVPGPEAEQKRSVDLEQAPDGTVSGKMFSWYNLTQLSMTDLFGWVLNGASLFTMSNESKVKIALAVLSMINDFFKQMSAPLNEPEAKALLAIFDVESDAYTLKDVQSAFQKRFDTAISDTQLQAFMDSFVKKTIVRYDYQTQLYSNRQSISFTR